MRTCVRTEFNSLLRPVLDLLSVHQRQVGGAFHPIVELADAAGDDIDSSAETISDQDRQSKTDHVLVGIVKCQQDWLRVGIAIEVSFLPFGSGYANVTQPARS